MIIDIHTHTDFSGDCNVPIREMIEAAKNAGVRYYGITDHHDLDFPECGINFELSVAEYFQTLADLKKEYDSSDFTLLIGIEFGLQPHLSEELLGLLEEFPFDYVIGSNHLAYGVDPYDKTFFNGMTRNEGYQRFFEATLENIEKLQGFHIIGHLDYVMRYWRGDGSKHYTYEQFAPILDQILLKIIEKNLCLEVNTSGYKYKLNQPHPSYEILQRYYELGGRLITLGSDAHLPTNIASSFEETIQKLKSIGYSYQYYFIGQERLNAPL